MAKNTPTTAELRETIKSIDALAQSELEQISSIARLAILGIENKCTEAISHLLHLIWEKSDSLLNDVNVIAEDVGCNHVGVAHE